MDFHIDELNNFGRMKTVPLQVKVVLKLDFARIFISSA